MTLVTAGRVGKPHGHDGSFYVEAVSQPLAQGESVTVGSVEHVVARRAGTGHGKVVRVLEGPSCSVLELSDGTLVPFVRDAVRSVGDEQIEINEDFLG